MASGSTLASPDLHEGARNNPNSMVSEFRSYGPVGAGGKRKLLRAPTGFDSEAIYEFIVNSAYSAATGITINIAYTSELPNTQGNIAFGGAVERVTSNVAGSTIAADSWGTEVVAAGALALAAAGAVKYLTLAIPKANFGGGTGASLAAHELARVRLRRVKSNALDTSTVDGLILGVEIQET